jgi:hypothetical protein
VLNGFASRDLAATRRSSRRTSSTTLHAPRMRQRVSG